MLLKLANFRKGSYIQSILRFNKGFYSTKSLEGIKRTSNLLLPTLKKVDAKYSRSHELMLRAGLIRQSASGLYSMLPLAMRSLRKLQQIIIEELEAGGCQQVDLPILSSAELWKKTGRWEEMDKELFRLKDRKGNELCLSPTFEEEMTHLVGQLVHSYKQLPLKIYQIGKKYRDEMRSRSGLLRTREFVMKDLYSFDIDEEHSLKTYYEIRNIYKKVFDRIGVHYCSVEADTGKIGGYLSHEYHFLSDVGEDTILQCTSCDYSANQELAKSNLDATTLDVAPLNDKGKERRSKLLNMLDGITSKTINSDTISQIMFETYKDKNEKYLIAVLPKDSTINNIKLDLHGDSMFSAIPYQSLIESRSYPNPSKLIVIADLSLKKHNIHTELSNIKTIDYKLKDIRNASKDEPCPHCNNPLNSNRAIEVAHTFHLEKYFSEPVNATFQDKTSNIKHFSMGCFGIGITRLLAATIEASSDAIGIRWPINIAPYKIMLLPMVKKEQSEPDLGDLYKLLKVLSNNYKEKLNFDDILLDDRYHLSTGFRLKDAELIGVPIQIRIGEDFKEGKIELFNRWDLTKKKINLNDLEAELIKLL